MMDMHNDMVKLTYIARKRLAHMRVHSRSICLHVQSAVMVRDGAFCLGFLGLTPVLEREILGTDVGITPFHATVLAGLMSGFIAGSSTHMFDTVKTKMQAHVGPMAHTYPDLLTTFRKVYTEGGFGLLMRGWVPRTARAMGAVVILSLTRNSVTDSVEKWRAEGLMM